MALDPEDSRREAWRLHVTAESSVAFGAVWILQPVDVRQSLCIKDRVGNEVPPPEAFMPRAARAKSSASHFWETGAL